MRKQGSRGSRGAEEQGSRERASSVSVSRTGEIEKVPVPNPQSPIPSPQSPVPTPHSLKNWLQKIALIACLLLLVSCQGKNSSVSNQVEVRVARVVSGQTLEVVGMAEQPNLISQVRLVGVDAPDLRQYPWGEQSKELLEKLVGDLTKPVKLEFDIEAKDKIGRTLAYVWKDNQLLNEQVIKQGYALFVERSPNQKHNQRLERAQQWARIMGKGIWNPEKPMRQTPAEFRRLNR
ncbi:micrococcal nuclease-like nuclease [Nostoc sp. PCC 7524]|uniref:thermonuclease family protein n=1 Tax=Nostoc sp. (strain ATCC 29411 / PCC 7524) TaxID=28072 RepID=UPI00029F0BBE|nr:micrococcal nuclease-like nuclease [Nostoc sp. PCC 7524]